MFAACFKCEHAANIVKTNKKDKEMKYRVCNKIDEDLFEVKVEVDGETYTGHLSQGEMDELENMTERDVKAWDVFKWSFWIDLHDCRGWEHEKA
jgi:hypothetical protein